MVYSVRSATIKSWPGNTFAPHIAHTPMVKRVGSEILETLFSARGDCRYSCNSLFRDACFAPLLKQFGKLNAGLSAACSSRLVTVECFL